MRWRNHPDKNCEHCGRQMDRKHAHFPTARFCSNKCRGEGQSYTPEQAEAIFWSRVNKDTPTGCWEYTGARDKWGYGDIQYLKKHVQAHRLAWRLLKGEPGELDVLHKCHRPPCCNPDHLYLGDDYDNIRDKVEAKRHQFGEHHCKAKLTEEQVREIRRDFRCEGRKSNLTELLERYKHTGISRNGLLQAARGASWGHLK